MSKRTALDPMPRELRGQLGAETRWGPQRRVNLGDLSPEGRRLILALIDAQRAAERARADEPDKAA